MSGQIKFPKPHFDLRQTSYTCMNLKISLDLLHKNDDADQGWTRWTDSITFIGFGSDDTFYLFLTTTSIDRSCIVLREHHAEIPFTWSAIGNYIFFSIKVCLSLVTKGYGFNGFQHVRASYPFLSRSKAIKNERKRKRSDTKLFASCKFY